jgi:hypothetical protein
MSRRLLFKYVQIIQTNIRYEERLWTMPRSRLPPYAGERRLPEKAATLGASTPFPTTLTVREIFSTGELAK